MPDAGSVSSLTTALSAAKPVAVIFRTSQFPPAGTVVAINHDEPARLLEDL
jgi:hypothetical protein